MELRDYNSSWIGCGRFRLTLECVGTDKDLATIQRVYNTGVYQLVSLTGSDEKGGGTMSNKGDYRRQVDAMELWKAEADAHNRGYKEGWEAREMLYDKTALHIKKVIFNDPATIVFWADGTKTVAKVHGDDKFDKEVGLTVCIAKKAMGNKAHWDKVFKKWIK